MPHSALRMKLVKRTLFHAAADVMNYTPLRACTYQDAHMRQPRIEQPRDNVAHFNGPWKRIARRRRTGGPKPCTNPRPIGFKI